MCAPIFGKAFLKYSSKGKLVPDDITIGLWSTQIDSMVQSGRFKPDIDFLVLDGIPRNINQAKILSSKLDVRRVFHLTCSDSAKIYDRLQRRALKENRLDDINEEVIERRLQHLRGGNQARARVSTAPNSSPMSTPTSGRTRCCATSSTPSSIERQ